MPGVFAFNCGTRNPFVIAIKLIPTSSRGHQLQPLPQGLLSFNFRGAMEEGLRSVGGQVNFICFPTCVYYRYHVCHWNLYVISFKATIWMAKEKEYLRWENLGARLHLRPENNLDLRSK